MKRTLLWMLCVCLLATVYLSAATRSVAAPKRPTDSTSFKKPVNLVYSPQLTNLLTSLDRLSSRSYTLKPDQVVRVLLEGNVSAAKIQHSGAVYVYALDHMKRYKFEGPNTLSARMKNGKVQVGWITSAQAIVIDPQTSVNLTFQNRVYNGVLVLIPKDSTMMVVEHLNLEEYLLGVVGHEMSPSWPIEALKAQTVTARTFARIKMAKKGPNYDLNDTPGDQVYEGAAGNIPDTILQAVNSTRGQVLMYNNELLQTFYHANCGGYTSDGEVLTGRDAPTPLKGVSCTACTRSTNACWQATVSNKTIDNFVRKNSKITEPIINVKVEQRKSAPKQAKRAAIKTAADLRFAGAHHSVVLSCSLFRQEVGTSQLKTCKIDKIVKDNSGKSFTFSGCGSGHGVGMCQDGAKGLAQKQYSYRDILKHYFPSSKLSVL